MTYKNYDTFVHELLSEPSSDLEALITRMRELAVEGCDVTRLITGSVGMSAETGEFLEVVKKVLLQGKPWDEANKFHLKRELSDIMFYVQTACEALGTTIEEVIDINIDKLESRFPGGKFTVDKSENRKEGDL